MTDAAVVAQVVADLQPVYYAVSGRHCLSRGMTVQSIQGMACAVAVLLSSSQFHVGWTEAQVQGVSIQFPPI